jgi:Tannase and feruloyl esterase
MGVLRVKIIALVMLILAGTAGVAHATSATPGTPAEAQCKGLPGLDFSGIKDASTQVTAAKVVEPAAGAPAYCKVQGYVSPQVGFELRLPLTNWNDKFMEVGCGGFCGDLSFIFLCKDPLQRGYACIVTDMGHKSTGLDGKWAYDNLQAQVDYGFRATHVAVLAGKAITEHYYGKAPFKSYYLGCSCGGRQGLVEAQQFPWDFDGIVVGAPAINFSGVFMDLLWKARAVADKEGNPLFSDGDIALVHSAAIAKCDKDDGVKDGLIGDPRTCKFDPADLACRAGAKTGCLSPEQVAAVKKFYSGPVTSKGERTFLGGGMPGSEAGDSGIGGYQSVFANFGREFFQYMGFVPAPGPSWKSSDFDFDRDYKRLGMLESLYASTNPDLRKFRAAGGKLILWQGWADGTVSPLSTIDYYEMVEKTMGGAAATRDFFRLFMMPGVDHCWGGEGASVVDFLSYMEAWVEKNQAPEMMISAHVKADVDPVNWPSDPASIGFTRPVYPYPLQAKYKGTGDPNKAESFGPAK